MTSFIMINSDPYPSWEGRCTRLLYIRIMENTAGYCCEFPSRVSRMATRAFRRTLSQYITRSHLYQFPSPGPNDLSGLHSNRAVLSWRIGDRIARKQPRRSGSSMKLQKTANSRQRSRREIKDKSERSSGEIERSYASAFPPPLVSFSSRRSIRTILISASPRFPPFLAFPRTTRASSLTPSRHDVACPRSLFSIGRFLDSRRATIRRPRSHPRRPRPCRPRRGGNATRSATSARAFLSLQRLQGLAPAGCLSRCFGVDRVACCPGEPRLRRP